jgi:Zn-dependent membrane protease YugP
MTGYYGFYFLGLAMTLIGMIISWRLKSKFNHYAQIRLVRGWSGQRVAQEMLKHYGLHDVQVVSVPGFLSDHYNPANKTVNLSPEVFSGQSIAAAAVAAHECGHAVQHAEAYAMLELRSKMVPVVQFASMTLQYAMLGAFLLANTFPSLLLIVIVLFGATTLFSFVTLPVEFDASRRALAWLNDANVTQGEEYTGAKDALTWAAMTYVSAALASLVQLIYLILRYTGSRN